MGILANSASVVHASSSATDVKAGYVTNERIVLSTSPTQASYSWGLTKPSGSTARSVLSDATSATPLFTPDVAGIYVITEGTSGFILRVTCTAVEVTSVSNAHRFSPVTDNSVPVPALGRTAYYSSDQNALVTKDPAGSIDAVAAVTGIGVAGARQFTIPRMQASEPNVGWIVQGGDFFGTYNQTFFLGHNPTRTGADANKPQLGIACELKFEATAGANPKAEWYGVWVHEDGTQLRPIGFTADYVTKLVNNFFIGEHTFLDDASTPTQLARITRSGQIVSDGGANKSFYAAGINREILAADKDLSGSPFNVSVIASVNNTELRLGGTGGSWTKVTCNNPWHFSGAVFANGGVTLPTDIAVQHATGLTGLQFNSSSQWVIGHPNFASTYQASVIYVLVDGTYIMNVEGAGVGIGTGLGSSHASAILECASTTKGVLLPRMASDPSSPADGLIYYNNSTNKFRGRANGAWVDLH